MSNSDVSSETSGAPPSTVPERTTRVRLGTFFSGIETPSIALQQAGIDHQLEFGIEMDDTLRQAVEEMWSPREMHGNIEEVNFLKLPAVDGVVGGPPCQSFCMGGNGNGLADDRGKLIFKMNDFVDDRAGAGKSLPKFLILENSKTLSGKYKFVLETIKSRFK